MALTTNRLKELLKQIPNLRIGLIGDACVDIYWEADMRRSELSREVPHYPLPVVNERFSLGGGSNVAANLVAEGLENLRFLTIAGQDWRGSILKNLFNKIGLSTEDLVISDKIVTPAYCKPIRCGISNVRYEDPRLDFSNIEPVPEEVEAQILKNLDRIAGEVDLLIVCDQLQNGCITPAVIARINELGKTLPVIVDSRDRIMQYENVIIKPNEVETARCLGLPPIATDDIAALTEAGATLSAKTNRPVVITLGPVGAFWYENGKTLLVPTYPAGPPIDFVGAGDSFLSGFSLAYAAHAAPDEALALGCLTSTVTIKKIGVTGTASPKELEALLASIEQKG